MHPEAWLLRLGFAAFLGALIGLEREIHGRPAGLRTHMLVSIGAAVITISGLRLASMFSPGDVLLAGPETSRIIAGIVTGIGFLGAGAIVRTSDIVRGLTTAACIWFIAAIGIVSGLGYFMLAGVSTAIALVVLTVLPFLESSVAVLKYRDLLVRGERDSAGALLEDCQKVLSDGGVGISDVDIEISRQGAMVSLLFRLRIRSVADKAGLLESLSKVDGVGSVTWQRGLRNL